MGQSMKMIFLSLLCVLEGLMAETEWNMCETNGWVPYRDNQHPNRQQYSFYACMYKNINKPGWISSHTKCNQKEASVAWWTQWKELAFYYNVFQIFKQTLSGTRYFMTFMNLRDVPFPSYNSHYLLYNPQTKQTSNETWNFSKESMIKLQHRRYVQIEQTASLDLNCAAFRMEQDDLIDSDIEFVPCNESTYKTSTIFDVQNDMAHFLCRKERAKCPAVTADTVGGNVVKIEGVYSYYYATMRKRQQQPKAEFLANVTHCHIGCGDRAGSVNYFSGDWLKYWCRTGYRTEARLNSQMGNYAVCSESGTWQFKPCTPATCSNTCQNGGVPYSAEGQCVCDCPTPFGGDQCTENVYTLEKSRACRYNRCKNNGLCVLDSNKAEGFRCSCEGAIGKYCEFEINECSSSPCAEGSLCVDKMNGYECICDPLRQGKHCLEVRPFCERFEEPCKNGADCYSCNSDTFKGWCVQENRTQYICNCKQGYAGPDCSLQIQRKADAWQIFAIVLGCMLFVIVSLFCEIIGSRRRHDHDNLQVLLESIDGYLKQRKHDPPKKMRSAGSPLRDDARYDTEYSDDSRLAGRVVRGRGRGRWRARWRGRGRGGLPGQTKVSVGGVPVQETGWASKTSSKISTGGFGTAYTPRNES